MFLQEFLVFAKGDNIIIVENDVRQLRIELVLVKIPVYLLEIGEQSVFLQLKIDIAFGEPGLG